MVHKGESDGRALLTPGRRLIAALALCVSVAFPAGGAEDYGLSGQLSGWLALNDETPSTPRLGLRYIPAFSLGRPAGRGFTLDAEASANAFATGAAPAWKDIDVEGRAKPYRFWVRLSSAQFELRAGLQKINFGSAALLRPLMWFDRMDARDPLQITDGVWGLLGRYYFVNNANVWAWALYGNDDSKGWEASPTAERTPEFGGRIQLPLATGEVGFTFHHRRADLQRGLLGGTQMTAAETAEDRYAVDGKWDVGIGIWAEGVLIRQAEKTLAAPYQRFLTVGADYTFGLGNGLHVLAEHFTTAAASLAFKKGEGRSFSGLSLNYPLGLLDQLAAVFFYDWKSDDLYSFLSWRRTYDNWQLLLMGFWNPVEFRV
ncbi:MAG: hypothetical protein OEW05_07585, partial [Candidatus Aminicenantes bacterium]|nr:hypothetical protein [Candidatus Aminicenantes bacterium]